jgi:hypothetical protein
MPLGCRRRAGLSRSRTVQAHATIFFSAGVAAVAETLGFGPASLAGPRIGGALGPRAPRRIAVPPLAGTDARRPPRCTIPGHPGIITRRGASGGRIMRRPRAMGSGRRGVARSVSPPRSPLLGPDRHLESGSGALGVPRPRHAGCREAGALHPIAVPTGARGLLTSPAPRALPAPKNANRHLAAQALNDISDPHALQLNRHTRIHPL